MTITFGELTRTGDTYTLEFERVLATDIDDAWAAVTEPERLARWMETYTGDLTLGGSWQALGSDGAVWVTGTVAECTPPHRFVTSWKKRDEEPTVITVTVEAVPEGARLRLRHEGLQSRFYASGWQTYLEQLDELLGAAEASVADPDRVAGVAWEERNAQLEPLWEQRFGD